MRKHELRMIVILFMSVLYFCSILPVSAMGSNPLERHAAGSLNSVNLLETAVNETSGECGEGCTWTVTDRTLLISGSGAVADFDIGAAPWADYRSSITSIVFENGITGIGNNAFSGCTALQQITIPGSVQQIGDGAFSSCSGLTSVVFEGVPDFIAGNAFEKSCSMNNPGSLRYPASWKDSGLIVWNNRNTQWYGGYFYMTFYKVNVVQKGGGTVVAGIDNAAEGYTVTLGSVANEGFEFESWSVTDSAGALIPVNDNIFKMPASDVTVSAVFTKVSDTIHAITINEGTGGTATADHTTAEEGDYVMLTAHPEKGYAFSYWNVRTAEGLAVSVENDAFVFPGSDVNVTAVFTPLWAGNYSITVNQTAGGTIRTPRASGGEGQQITLTAEPDEGYELDSWTIVDETGTMLPVVENTFEMPASNVTVEARFTKVDYTSSGETVQTWVRGSMEGAVFTFQRSVNDNLSAERFQKLQVDGTDAEPDWYETAQERVEITLLPAFLESLSDGKHTITAVFEDGSAEGTLNISKEKSHSTITSASECRDAGWHWDNERKACVSPVLAEKGIPGRADNGLKQYIALFAVSSAAAVISLVWVWK